MIVISVIRKGASKRLSLSVMDSSHYLSILQIFESTDDVVDYQVSELDKSYNHKDKYLPDMQGFDKWKPIKQ
jgi:hypothetical protein